MSALVSPIPVEIVIPVYNEERALAASVRKLHRCMKREFMFPFRITVADNASSDGTLQQSWALAREIDEVHVLRLEQKGRGRALRAAWTRSEAEVVAYMDVDLSTELSALPSLLVPLLQRRADVAIGTRLAPGAEVTRGIKRELISRSYNILLRVALGVGFSDAQCGFKAARRETLVPLLERVEDDAWFFDTELLYRAERSKLAIHEVPVRWVDDPDSRVDILATVREDLRGIRRLRRAAVASGREATTNAREAEADARAAEAPAREGQAEAGTGALAGAGPHAVTTPATTISGSWPGTTVKPSSRIARRRSAERAC